jgi:hypothetical protein
MTLPGQQRKNATNATVASPVEAGNAARPSEDLMTSEARLPVALSLKGKRDRLKNHNVGTSKPRC